MFIRPLILVTVLLTGVLLSACDKETSTSRHRSKTDHLVELAPAEIQAVRAQLTSSNSLQPRRIARISNEIAGRVVKLSVNPGDAVSQGELLLQLDDSLIQVALEKARAQTLQAQSDFDRLNKLKPKQLASDEEIARARTALLMARAEEKLQRTRLQRATLKAPFDGVVTERLVETGDVLPVNTHALTLIDPDSLYLKIRVAGQWIPWLAVGDYVSVRIPALGDNRFDASIARIYPAIDAATRKGTIEVKLSPQPFGARAGQLAIAEFYTQSADRLVIPANSLHHDSQGAFVYTVDSDNQAHKTRIETGQQYGDMIAVTAGLTAQSRVVVKGSIGLREGKTVKVVEPAAATP